MQQDKIIYDYYPAGIIQGLSRLGGLIAIFNIGIILNFVHQYKFNKEINNELKKWRAVKGKEDENEGAQKKIYSIENFNILIRRIKKLEEKTQVLEESMLDKKIN